MLEAKEQLESISRDIENIKNEWKIQNREIINNHNYNCVDGNEIIQEKKKSVNFKGKLEINHLKNQTENKQKKKNNLQGPT